MTELFQKLMTQISSESIVGARPAISHAFRVRLQHLPSLMRDTYLRLLPYLKKTFATIAPTLYIEKNCPNLIFVCPICQSHSIACLSRWQVWLVPAQKHIQSAITYLNSVKIKVHTVRLLDTSSKEDISGWVPVFDVSAEIDKQSLLSGFTRDSHSLIFWHLTQVCLYWHKEGVTVPCYNLENIQSQPLITRFFQKYSLLKIQQAFQKLEVNTPVEYWLYGRIIGL